MSKNLTNTTTTLLTNDEWRQTNQSFRTALQGLIKHLTKDPNIDRDKYMNKYDTKRQASKFRRGVGDVYNYMQEKNKSV